MLDGNDIHPTFMLPMNGYIMSDNLVCTGKRRFIFQAADRFVLVRLCIVRPEWLKVLVTALHYSQVLIVDVLGNTYQYHSVTGR